MFYPCHKNNNKNKKKKNNPNQKTLSLKVEFDTEDPSLVNFEVKAFVGSWRVLETLETQNVSYHVIMVTHVMFEFMM